MPGSLPQDWSEAWLQDRPPPGHDSRLVSIVRARRREVRGGPWMPCAVVYGPPMDPDTLELMDRSPIWYGLDARGRPIQAGAWFLHVEPIDAPEHAHMAAMAAWAKRWAPDHPMANPGRKLDWRTGPIPWTKGYRT